VLLSWTCKVFLEAYWLADADSVNSVDLSLELGESIVKFSSKWLLNQLIIYLQPYLIYKCVHKKLVPFSGIDVLVSLSWVLGSLETSNDSYSEPLKDDRSQFNKEHVLADAGHILNDILHEENKKQSFDDWLVDPSLLSIPLYLQKLNPLLVNFLLVATGSVHECQHCHRNEHTKLVCIFFIICLLQFSTNTKPTIIHHLLSDVAEVCGGSRELMRVLNRPGCVSSPDTHDRFVTEQAQLKR